MKVHNLKCWPAYFDAIRRGSKRFEYRKDDRNFGLGDILDLHEWDPDVGMFTGQELRVQVLYILRGPSMGVPDGWVIMSIMEVA